MSDATVDGKTVLIDGRHRLEAAKKLKRSSIPAISLGSISNLAKQERLRQIIREELEAAGLHVPRIRKSEPEIPRCPEDQHDWGEYGPHGPYADPLAGRKCKKCGAWSSV